MRAHSMIDYVLGMAFVLAVGGVMYQYLSLPNSKADRKFVTPTAAGSSFIADDANASPKSFARPRMVVPEPTFDLGMIGSREAAKHEFEIFNEGDADLVIDPIMPTCGCTYAHVSQHQVKPGEKTIISVEWELENYAGKQRRSIVVTSNDSLNSPLLLRLTGTVNESQSDNVVQVQ